jgi:hypothetical protein
MDISWITTVQSVHLIFLIPHSKIVIIIIILLFIFNCRWVLARWQFYYNKTHNHTNNTNHTT